MKTTQKDIRSSQKSVKKAKIGEQEHHIVYEGDFLKNAARSVKDFFKNSYKTVKKKGKDLIKHLKKNSSDKKSSIIMKPGTMCTYKYDAKDKTQKFDKQPLVISLGPSKQTKGNFYALNLHWMPVKDRVSIASFFVELRKKRNGNITYKDIKPFLSKFKGHPVLRQYIYKRVGSRVIYINDDELFLSSAAIDTADWFKP